MQKITTEQIEEFVNTYPRKNQKVYRSQMNKYAKIANMFENEDHEQILVRLSIGISAKSFSSLKSTSNKFTEFFKSANAPAKKIDAPIQSSAKLEESVRQAQELAKIQAEELAKTQAKAKAEAERLEQIKKAEAEAKANAEAERLAQLKAERLARKTQGFKAEEIPNKIIPWNIEELIPKKSITYIEGGNEKTRLYSAFNTGKNVILAGHAGAGKSESAVELAKINKLPLVKYSCNVDTDLDELIGAKTVNEKGVKFEAGAVTKAVMSANKIGKAVLILDEINCLGEKTQKILNGLFDGTGFVDCSFGRLQINNGVNLFVIGTMNKNYSGTGKLNPEFKDRFALISMPKLSRKIKSQILEPYGLDEKFLNQIFDVSDKLEKLQKDNIVEDDVVFSIRSQKTLIELVEEFEAEKIKDAKMLSFEMTLIDKFDDEEEAETVRNMVKEILKWPLTITFLLRPEK